MQTVLEIIKLKYMTKVDFTDWLHSELAAVFAREQTPEEMMLKAIPMINAVFSENSSKPLTKIYSFAEALAKGDHEWRYSDKDELWHKDGWANRTTDELMKLFPELL